VALQFLGRICDPDMAACILPLLCDSDYDVRHLAAEALGTMGNPIAIEGLVVALTDEESRVRTAAELALEKLDKDWVRSDSAKSAVPKLKESLGYRPSWVRSSILQLLDRITHPDERSLTSAETRKAHVLHMA
jgi:HEAT repeat protein